MTYTLTITNASEDFIKGIKAMAKAANASVKAVKSTDSARKRTPNGYTAEFEAELLKELKETKRAYEKGDIKAMSVKEFRKAVDNGAI